MLVVKIELWPHGDENKKRMLGECRIANDGTGTLEKGNYNVQLMHAGRYWGKGVWKTGRVEGFLRKLNPYQLVMKSIAAALKVQLNHH